LRTSHPRRPHDLFRLRDYRDLGLDRRQRKLTGRDPRVLPRVVLYDPDLTLTLSAAVSAASAMNALAHCVEGLWVPERTPYLEALASEAARRFMHWLPRIVAAGTDREARAECLAAAWLAGVVLAAGTGLQHKLAHVLGGLGLPHAETHAVILPHVARFNLAAAPAARFRLAAALGDDPAARLAGLLASLPLQQRLGELGFEREWMEPVAAEITAMAIALPRPVSGADVRALLAAAY
jgi:maleylacetate reductase